MRTRLATVLIPAPYVKLYLVNGKKCIEKAKTTMAHRKTLDPLYQQVLAFKENWRGCILQVRASSSSYFCFNSYSFMRIYLIAILLCMIPGDGMG